MTSLWLAWQLGLSLWGVVTSWNQKRVPRVHLAQKGAVNKTEPLRQHWLLDWGGWILVSSVGGFAPAIAPEAPLWLQVVLFLVLSGGLLRLSHALDSRPVGHGVIAGLGLIALSLDSVSGGAWARQGALGHSLAASGVGDLYGILAIVWGMIACRAWLTIEGNPLGVAYLTGLIALWLAWKGLSPALGWGATVSALTLSLQVLQRERSERRRVRLTLQNQPVRVVRLSNGRDLALHGAILLGLCAVALWRSGVPALQPSGLSPLEGWYLAIGITCGVGILRTRSVRPLPTALQRAWLVGALTTALLSAQPLGVVALGLLLYWAPVGTALQETPIRLSNLPVRTGGNE
ncbi:MAG: hypothetical protein N2651_09480 [Fimbriimonadales bacterium]|nr:hypothetical protein [Fimbriimonadales bacterium]